MKNLEINLLENIEGGNAKGQSAEDFLAGAACGAFAVALIVAPLSIFATGWVPGLSCAYYIF